ncbi:DUF3324 domain-containing protein, partial [Enterococcus raffinosus]
ISIPENSSKEVTLKVKMPEKRQTGVIMGGIVVSEQKEDTQKTKRISVGNTFSYTLGVLLTNDNDKTYQKNISLDLTDVEAKLLDGRKIVEAKILNNNPYIFGTAKMEGKIMSDDSHQVVIHEKKQEGISIAPFSIFPFQIDYGKDELTPGKYVFKGVVTTDEKKWHFIKKFEITGEQAKKINKESVFKVRISPLLTNAFYILIISNVIALTVIILKRGKNDE